MSHALRSPHKKKEQKKKLAIVAVILVALLVTLVVLFFWVTTSPSYQIKDVEVRGNEMFSGDDLVRAVKSDISGKYLYLFPRSNIFFYPQSTIQKDIEVSFPRFKNAGLYVNEDRVLVVTLAERSPSALWCGSQMLSSPIDETCYYVDDSGFIFGDAPTFSGGSYLKLYGDGGVKLDHPVGSFVVSGDLFKKISDLYDVLLKYDPDLTHVYLNEDGTIQWSGTKNCKLLFDTEQPLSSLQSNIDAVFTSTEWGGGIAGSDMENACDKLEYIDFRFGNKVYYREKSKTPKPSQIDSTATSSTASVVTPAGTQA